jgi:hypothetical protein
MAFYRCGIGGGMREQDIGDVISANITDSASGIKLTWVDPENITDSDGNILSAWGGTLVVRKEDSIPLNESDGDVILDNKIKNSYSVTPLVDSDASVGKNYYYRFFTYTAYKKYTYGTVLNATHYIKLVPWSAGTDEEIANMFKAYYNGDISLSDVKSVWSVGDTRNVNISAMPTYGKLTDTHAAQTQPFTIIDFNHDTLQNSINGKTRSLITWNMYYTFFDGSTNEPGMYGPSGYVSDSAKWETCARRQWCNNTFLNALPTYLKNLIKPVLKYTSGSYSDKTVYTVVDNCFLLSYYEVYGKVGLGTYVEGSQYQYFNEESNTNKHIGNSDNHWAYYSQWLSRTAHRNGEDRVMLLGKYNSASDPNTLNVGSGYIATTGSTSNMSISGCC